jgi:hypothetical protein
MLTLGENAACRSGFSSVHCVAVALTAEVTLGIVQRVTGHRIAGIAMNQCCERGREEFRRSLASKLPVLPGSQETEAKPIDAGDFVHRLRTMSAET